MKAVRVIGREPGLFKAHFKWVWLESQICTAAVWHLCDVMLGTQDPHEGGECGSLVQ